jgi:hypothetical protein
MNEYVAEVYKDDGTRAYLRVENGKWGLTSQRHHAYGFRWERDYDAALATWHAMRPRGWSRELEFVSVFDERYGSGR